MSKIFKKSFNKGFTLIELLVVIAIIGLLSTVIAAPITQARKKGRDGKKIADIRQITSAIQQYADDHVGNYPYTINTLVPIYLSAMPPFALGSAPAKDRYMYTNYVANDGRVVGFHLGSKLEAPNLGLSDDRDCYGAGTITPTANYCIDVSLSSTNIMTASATNFSSGEAFDDSVIGVGASSTAPTFVRPGTNYDGMTATSTDFAGGADVGDTPCTAAINTANITCIYDITN